MSRLIIVRHAQASFFEADYDKLSGLGQQQAALLGAHWKRQRVQPDRVVCGPRCRHQETARIVGEQLVRAGNSWPPVEIFQEYDEHNLDRLLGSPLGNLVERYPSLSELSENYQRAATPTEKQRNFQRLFEAVGKLWREEAAGTESIEPWGEYRAKVVDSIRTVLQSAEKNSTIALFTSVGGVAAALTGLLGCSDEQAFELGWRLRNTSVTEFVFSGQKITLDTFNHLSHLSEMESWTFR